MPSIQRRHFLDTDANVLSGADARTTKEMIRAGGTFAKAIPGAFSHPPESLDPLTTRCRPMARINSRRNTRPMLVFGATRDEGAVGPVAALSPYAEAARFRCHRPVPKNWKPCRAQPQTLRTEPLPSVAKGPTAEAILSMTASGRKPPVPESSEEKKREKLLPRASGTMAAAAFYGLEDCQPTDSRTENISNLPNKISGYHQTWGVAFLREPLVVRGLEAPRREHVGI